MSEATHRPTGPAHPTRQQLDELEALMQRMLELPVNHLDDDARPPLDNIPPAAVLPASPPWPGPLADSEAIREPRLDFLPASPGLPVDQPSHREEQPAVLPFAMPPAGLKRRKSIGRLFRPRTVILLRPLLWINRVFDRTVGRLGRPGRWLRGAAGRTLLGWIGLLCLAGALALGVLDLLGWSW
jgi:hypothetical protein